MLVKNEGPPSPDKDMLPKVRNHEYKPFKMMSGKKQENQTKWMSLMKEGFLEEVMVSLLGNGGKDG